MEILGCVLPEDRLYDLDESVWWAEDPADGSARVGILATLGSFAGPVHSFAFRNEISHADRGRSVGTLESVRYTGAVRLPVGATILDRNERLPSEPRLLNDAPYTDGWVVRVRPDRADDPPRYLASAATIAARLEDRIREQRIRCWPRTPDLELIEVGLECSAVLTKLNEELARLETGSALLLVTDDPTSPIEMVRWSDQSGYPVLAHRREGPLHQFLVRKVADPRPRVRGAGGVV